MSQKCLSKVAHNHGLNICKLRELDLHKYHLYKYPMTNASR